tara:strand:- start:30 stop:173 length:144 start_codon:yes stop_codon:yes gene_type:complete
MVDLLLIIHIINKPIFVIAKEHHTNKEVVGVNLAEKRKALSRTTTKQ